MMIKAFPLALLLASCATHAPSRPDGLTVPNFAEVTPALYRGGQPDAEGYRQLAQMGVKTVISFRYFSDAREDAEAAGLDFVRMPIHASITSSPPSEVQLEEFFDIVLDPARQPVFIHCKHGSDRTGTMAAIYRMECEGWDCERAVEEMQAFGYHDYYIDLIDCVRCYEPGGYAQAAR